MSRTTRFAGLAFALGLLGCVHRSAPGVDPGAAARHAVVEANLSELQDCWDDLASDHGGVAGSLLFSVDLRRNGSVEWVELAVDELGIAKLSACTVRHVKKWRFPADRKRRSISFGVGFRG